MSDRYASRTALGTAYMRAAHQLFDARRVAAWAGCLAADQRDG
jgi:hypothetical protein